MDSRYFDLYCDTQVPNEVTDANGVPIDPADLRITHGETLVLRCHVETDGEPVDLTGLTARLTAKDPNDRDATTPLLYSVDNSDGWTDLAEGLVAITVGTSTAALSAHLSDIRPTRRVLLSIHLYDGATPDPFLATELEATAVRPAEAATDNTPPPALNGILAAIAALASATAGTIIEVTSTGGAVALRTITSYGKSLVACVDAAAARTALGLGTIATAAATAYALIAHGHSGTTDGSKLAQANTHESADTDAGASSLHHTLGTGANQAAAGNDARLSDARAPTAAGLSTLLDTITSGSPATTVDVSLPNHSWSGNGTVTVTATANGASGKLLRTTILITASAGSLTVNLPAAWLWPTGNKPASDQIVLSSGEQGQLIVEDWGTAAVVAYYAKLET